MIPVVTEAEAQARAAGLVGAEAFRARIRAAVTAFLNANTDDEDSAVALGSCTLVAYSYELSGMSAADFVFGVQSTVDEIDADREAKN